MNQRQLWKARREQFGLYVKELQHSGDVYLYEMTGGGKWLLHTEYALWVRDRKVIQVPDRLLAEKEYTTQKLLHDRIRSECETIDA